jgi:hypothetical protein
MCRGTVRGEEGREVIGPTRGEGKCGNLVGERNLYIGSEGKVAVTLEYNS